MESSTQAPEGLAAAALLDGRCIHVATMREHPAFNSDDADGAEAALVVPITASRAEKDAINTNIGVLLAIGSRRESSTYNDVDEMMFTVASYILSRSVYYEYFLLFFITILL